MTLRTGFIYTSGGMNQSIDSSRLRDDQYSRGVNISSRGGKASTRPVFSPISIPDADFTTGKYFGGANYHLDSVDRLIVGVAGKVLGINMTDLSVTDYTSIAGITLDTTVDRYYFQQADKYMIVQDGVNRPLIIDDVTAFRAAGTQVPTGTKMAYGHGRLFVVVSTVGAVANLGERFFVAGDIIKPNDVANLLQFTETDYLAEGGAMSLPNELGFITSLQFIRNTQSGQGLGSLIVLAQNGASAFAVQASRTNWKDIDLSQVLFTNGGSVSPFTFIPVNNDLYYRSLDGIRSIGYSTATTIGQSALIANNPISENVRPDLSLDNRAEQYFCSMVYSGDRILTLVNADITGTDEYFKGMVSIDSAVLSTFGAESPPIYDGIWTGLDFLQLVKSIYSNTERVIIIAKKGGLNTLFYLDESGYKDDDTEPVCRLYSKSYDFGQVDDLKTFDYANVYVSDIRGTVSLTLYYRPKGYPLWAECATGTFTASYDGVTNLAQRYKKLVINKTGTYCDPVTENPLHKDVDFEYCLQWTGFCKIEKILFYAEETDSKGKLLCDVSSTSKTLAETGDAGVSLDDYEYEVA